MEVLWFCLIAFMLAMYVVLDGFDFGVGILHLMVAKNDEERQQVHRAIGPVWDGNEVWLIALGGTLFMAFPKLFSVVFSGFYLPLIILLWLLMFRGLGIELRHQLHDPLWKQFWDVAFALSSLLLALVMGTALGNLVRGVSLNEEGMFFAPLWTNFLMSREVGVFDWFTLLYGITTTIVLTHHGALWLAWRTDERVQKRAKRFAMLLWPGALISTLALFVASYLVQPNMAVGLGERPWIGGGMLVAVGMLIGTRFFRIRDQSMRAFLSSCLYLFAMVVSGASWVFPYVLVGRETHEGLTAIAAASSEYGLQVALYWWFPGVLLVFGYMTYVFRTLLSSPS